MPLFALSVFCHRNHLEAVGLRAINNIVASPVAADGMVYLSSSYVKRAMMAIRLEGAKGDITDWPHK